MDMGCPKVQLRWSLDKDAAWMQLNFSVLTVCRTDFAFFNKVFLINKP